MACVCAEKARLENRKRSGADKFHAFALHYWGECYGRTKSQLEELKKRSESHRCTGSQDYDGCRVVHDHCVGHGYAEYVYQLREASAEESMYIPCDRSSTMAYHVGFGSVRGGGYVDE